MHGNFSLFSSELFNIQAFWIDEEGVFNEFPNEDDTDQCNPVRGETCCDVCLTTEISFEGETIEFESILDYGNSGPGIWRSGGLITNVNIPGPITLIPGLVTGGGANANVSAIATLDCDGVYNILIGGGNGQANGTFTYQDFFFQQSGNVNSETFCEDLQAGIPVTINSTTGGITQPITVTFRTT